MSLLCLVGVLFAGRLLLTKFATNKPWPLLTLLIMETGNLVSALVLDYLLLFAGISTASKLPMRMISSTAGVLPALVLVALIVTFSREFNQSNRSLSKAANNLVETRNQASQRIADRQEQVAFGVKSRLSRELELIAAERGARVTYQMNTLIDDVVRPLSYQLARQADGETHSVQSIPTTKIPWQVVIQNALNTNPFHPIATPLWIAAIAGGFYIATFGFVGIITTVLVFAVASFITALEQYLWRFIPRTTSLATRLILFLILLFPISYSTALVGKITTPLDLTAPLNITLWFLLCQAPMWVITLTFSSNQLMEKTKTQLASTIADLEREIISLNNAYRQQQRMISRVLHGPVQDAINSTIYRLQSSPKLESSVLIGEMKERIEQALEQINSAEKSSTDLDRLFDEIVELWEGVVNIRIDITPGDSAAIKHDEQAAYTLGEVVREACANAIRHGEAKNIHVKVSIYDEARAICVTSENDGLPFPLESIDGLGTQMLNELCLNWRREQVENLTLLTAQIPLVVN